jgi:hypothetical protein
MASTGPARVLIWAFASRVPVMAGQTDAILSLGNALTVAATPPETLASDVRPVTMATRWPAKAAVSALALRPGLVSMGPCFALRSPASSPTVTDLRVVSFVPACLASMDPLVTGVSQGSLGTP